MSVSFDLDASIRKVPDFPKPGILFYDITSVLLDPVAFEHCITQMHERYRGLDLDAVIAVESRGFLFATPFARARGLPVILARKPGKLPGATYRKSYELEYGSDSVEIQRSDLRAGQRVLIVDDLVATGGTLKAIAQIVESVEATVAGVFCVVGLPFLSYAEKLAPLRVDTLIEYHGE